MSSNKSTKENKQNKANKSKIKIPFINLSL